LKKRSRSINNEPKELVLITLNVKDRKYHIIGLEEDAKYIDFLLLKDFWLTVFSSDSTMILRIHLRHDDQDHEMIHKCFLSLENPEKYDLEVHGTATRLDSCITTMRMYHALLNCEKLILLPYILNPRKYDSLNPEDARIWDGIPIALLKRLNETLNPSQFDAVKKSVCRKNSFSLLQGPPGSGKTKTVISLFKSIMNQLFKLF
jgi:hypothetical protein